MGSVMANPNIQKSCLIDSFAVLKEMTEAFALNPKF